MCTLTFQKKYINKTNVHAMQINEITIPFNIQPKINGSFVAIASNSINLQILNCFSMFYISIMQINEIKRIGI